MSKAGSKTGTNRRGGINPGKLKFGANFEKGGLLVRERNRNGVQRLSSPRSRSLKLGENFSGKQSKEKALEEEKNKVILRLRQKGRKA